MCCCVHTVVEQATFWDEFAPTLAGTLLGGGISVAVAVFIFRAEKNKESEARLRQERLNATSKKKEIDRSWYLNVLVNPNLERIEGFFSNVRELVVETVTELTKAKDGSINDYNQLKAIRTKLFKDELRKFEYDFIKLIQSNSTEISEKMMEWSRSFDDIVSNYVDTIVHSDSINDDDVLKRLSAAKSEFYKILNEPLKNE